MQNTNLNNHPVLSLLNSSENNHDISFEKKDSDLPYLFIDGSYFCFYCYFSVERWWKFAFPTDLDIFKNPIQNPLFVEKFKNKCKKIFESFVVNLKISLDQDRKPLIYIGKDCKRENIWRNKIYPGYKGNRNDARNQNVGGFFQLMYQELFPMEEYKNLGLRGILEYEFLEADDCIAICVMKLLQDEPLRNIYIVTSDRDYLQLAKTPLVQLYDLSFKKLTESKGSSGNAECDLFCKIVMGDKSDNITSVFKKCGPKTALKYFHNRELFEAQLKKENAYEKYALNEKVISFYTGLIPYLMNSI